MAKFGLGDWANVAEIFAATGVIISLIFVGLQIERSRHAQIMWARKRHTFTTQFQKLVDPFVSD